MAPTLSSSMDQHHPLIIPSASNPTSNPAPSAARIRENQRRSRARRKEYLQELEHKLRKCEQAGVRASVDIQLAARGVAEDNKRLKEENRRLKEEGEKLRRENERMRAKLDGNQQERAGASKGRKSVAGASSHGIQDAEAEAPSQLQDSTDRQQPTTGTEGEEIYTQLTPMPTETSSEVSYIGQNDQMVLGDDTSSCEYAAHIITSMRADISTDDVRADLGCGGDIREWRKCKVDNSKLFVAVDRYTG
ncbi:hypothetical protein HO133_007532 [Letharia lupina]|uniref:BZIP domain-containing protein n=1 Tax=Letharia lupina TaxID=560253 RepID=A0A8H6FJ13_9LECA|nr:uncharacterized protein HO133_007532 [Letharia lupina]KAF6229416.1 hypothetical protein HO133_007532 [Letharia lupina]